MSAEEFSGTSAVAAAHRFDESRLFAWLAGQVPGFQGPLTVSQFRGGQSNPTYRLDTPGGSYVLRRKPPGALLKGAHAVEREARVMQALEGAGFPVPHIHGLCTDDAVIGTWFYVMDYLRGRIFWDATLPEVPRAERPALYDSMNETLARLHGLQPAALGLADFGHAGNYCQRQISRWSKQYLADTEAGRDPNLDRLIAWLPDNIPPGDETSLVHGDYRIDNLVFHPHEPRVIGVLDWELATLGHPLSDFAYHLMAYRLPPLPIPSLAGADLAALNLPGESDYVADYCRRTGRPAIQHLDFYIAFNLFRLAAIFHGIKGRLARGTAVSPHAIKLVRALPALAECAWRQAERAGA
ncbi:MAG TPA: phosphotransferase [Steroidobacteraceae bacterium]|nr:phosphotransferase [Steroidobacteraceae bacterium]